jgi:hypothetical protein
MAAVSIEPFGSILANPEKQANAKGEGPSNTIALLNDELRQDVEIVAIKHHASPTRRIISLMDP